MPNWAVYIGSFGTPEVIIARPVPAAPNVRNIAPTVAIDILLKAGATLKSLILLCTCIALVILAFK